MWLAPILWSNAEGCDVQSKFQAAVVPITRTEGALLQIFMSGQTSSKLLAIIESNNLS